MKKYKLKKINSANIKHFSISLGLLPGYDINKESHTYEVVSESCKKWIREGLENSDTIFPVKIIPSKFVYGFRQNKNIICNSENAVEIQGEIMREYCEDIYDDNKRLLTIIKSLAVFLGKTVEQERIHIEFLGKKYILE